MVSQTKIIKNSLIILTLNEIEGVRAIFDKILLNTADEVFVIDGGSTDGTIEFFKEKGIRVIIQDKKGRAEAFAIGVRQARGEDILFFSPDGNEDPQDIPKLFCLLDSSDMVIASRFMAGSRNEEGGKLFPLRAWVNRAFSLMANLAWNKKKFITDTINGFRAIKKDAYNKLNLDATGFVVEYQMSIRAMKLGLEVKEIPTWEGNRIGGNSKAKSLPTGWLFLKFFIKELFSPKLPVAE
jgi:glycosyltransferase involved in cell wall biosynthesis